MNDVSVNDFINQTLNQDGNDSAIFKTNYYNTPNLIFQDIPIKEKIKNIEVNRTRKGYIIDTLTSVDICEIVKTGGKVIRRYQGFIYQKNFKITPIRKVIEKLFNLKQIFKNGNNDLMHGLVKLVMNSLYGVQIRKEINGSYYYKSEPWMKAEYDENVLDYRKLTNGIYNVKMKKDDGLDDDFDF